MSFRTIKRPLRTKRRLGEPSVLAGSTEWDRHCARCKRQCNERGLSRDGLSECPLGGRHVLAEALS